MRLLVIGILAVIGCERTDDTPRPVPDDARVIASDGSLDCSRDPDAAQRLVGLDRWYAYSTSAQRKRSAGEAPIALTNAYVDLEFAYGYARLGRKQRVKELLASAHAALDPVVTDEVHAVLLAIYEERIVQATWCQPPGGRIAHTLEARVAKLEKPKRFEVNLLHEMSRVLTHRPMDPAIAFSRRWDSPFGPQLEAIRAMADPASRADALAKLLAKPPESGRDRNLLIAGVLEAIPDLPQTRARPLLEHVVSLMPNIWPDWDVWARALTAAVAVDLDIARALVGVITKLSPQQIPALDRVLVWSVRALKPHREILRMLIKASTWAKPSATDPPRLGVAAAHLVLNDPGRARPILDDGVRAFERQSLPDRRVTMQALTQAYSFAPVELCLTGLERLFDGYQTVTDRFGSYPHFSPSVISFNSMIVLGIVGE